MCWCECVCAGGVWVCWCECEHAGVSVDMLVSVCVLV